MEVAEVPMLEFGGGAQAVPGMIAWGTRLTSAVAMSHNVQALS